MSRRRKPPADAPSTYVDPDFKRRRGAELLAERERPAQLAGPVTVRRIPTNPTSTTNQAGAPPA